jgi:hypothetical protein
MFRPLGLHALGQDVARADGVDADAVRPVLRGHLPGQPDDRRLDGLVHQVPGRNEQTVRRRDVDDRATAGLAQMRHGVLRGAEH